MTFTDRSTTLLAGDFRCEVEASRARMADTARVLNRLDEEPEPVEVTDEDPSE